MTHHFLILLLVMAANILCAPISAQETSSNTAEKLPLTLSPAEFGDVRGFIWGVSPADVQQYETTQQFDKVDDTLFFIDDLHKIKTLISYEFRDKKLWRVTFDMQKDAYPDPQKILDDYMAFQTEITEKMGAPEDEKMIWSRNYYKDKPNRWGLAVYNGDLTLETIWWSGTTKTILRLNAKGYDYNFKATYISRKAMIEGAKNDNQNTMDLLKVPEEEKKENW